MTAATGKSTNAGGAYHASKTHCPYNHAYTPENTRLTPQGFRVCRTCMSNRDTKKVPVRIPPTPEYNAPQDQRWRDKAACADKDPELFQPKDEVTAHRAARICRENCPVILQCAIEAKAQGPWIVGVWAGKWYREPTVKKPKP